jgi:hypothetical protein
MASPIVNPPVIIDAGKAKKRHVRQMSRGCGKLMSDVDQAVAQVTSTLGDQADNRQIVPVVLVYRRKRKRRRRGGGGGGGGGIFPLLFN